jgi:hypothetical protein
MDKIPGMSHEEELRVFDELMRPYFDKFCADAKSSTASKAKAWILWEIGQYFGATQLKTSIEEIDKLSISLSVQSDSKSS